MTASRRLLTGVLREQLGFEGIVVSDWAAVDQLRQQGAAADRMQAAKAAFLSGVELDMSDGCFMECLPTLIRQEKEEAGRSGLEQRLDVYKRQDCGISKLDCGSAGSWHGGGRVE